MRDHGVLSRRLAAAVLATAVAGAFAPDVARAASPGGAPAAYSASVTSGAGAASRAAARPISGGCDVASTLANTLNPFSHCNPARQALGAAGSVPGALAKAAATGVMDQITEWMVKAAQTISGWVVKQAGEITSPDLNANWYLRLFSGLAALGGVLAGLVALVALASAAIRKDPDALGEVVYGVARAGIGTSIVVALTIIALSAADGIANDFARQMPADFYKTLSDQWGGSGWGGFGAAALAFLVAFVATIAGLLVWLELIVREAAIYIAVLFFPVGLAASIWPALRSWVRRLSMLLLMFVLLRPVVVIVLALAGNVTASGLSFGNGSIPHSVGTILAGVVIFALAAFTPWALMFLLGTEIGVMHSRGGGSTVSDRSSSGGGSERVGGGLSAAPLFAGAGEPAMAAAGSDAKGGGSGGGAGLSSLGGSGAGGARSSGGPIAAAAGWMGGVAGAAGRVGGQLSQQAAARIHVAAGRSGVAPGGVLPPSTGGLDGSSGSPQTRTAEPEPPPPARQSQRPSFADSVFDQSPTNSAPSSADAPSPADTASSASPPSGEGGPDGPPQRPPTKPLGFNDPPPPSPGRGGRPPRRGK